ncbi:MAG: tRNA (N6-isopentenyl adenosine(37)-C2)-methylthiotransferase MiaB [Candidatus Aminicenantes bacterium]|nr:MAG: tRNA (N6-isopentenyl adenosine(37)-C2)-methylthiotransferase MiaB [Candidatus Aminicenantes bacterium]
MKKTRDLENYKFYIHTFGCQMNENDSERIAGILTKEGAKISALLEESNLIILNTCAVREKSEEKLYSFLGRLASLKKTKNITIGVAGCVAQLYGSELSEQKPFVDFVIGPDNYQKLPQIISDNIGEKILSTSWSPEWQETPSELIFRESQVSAYVTIMEGCNNFCSYCIVPFTRGREKCRPIQNIIHEVKDLADTGYLEIQLLGQNVNSYRDPQTGKDFSALLRELNRVDGIEWIRFITSHPKNFSPEIGFAIKESEKVCRQLHLPVQSGSSSVLKRMNRGYTREDYLEKIELLRDLMPDINLSTDIIVGFPGETDEEYKETFILLEKVRFTNIFSFRYSVRPKTAASKKQDTVPLEEKRRRLIEVQSLQKKIQLEHNQSLIGSIMKVLCLGESKKAPRIFSGRNEGYQVVNFKSKKDFIGKFVDVCITSCGPYSLIGEIVL